MHDLKPDTLILMPESREPTPPKKIKFIRKVWARLNAKLDAIPKHWMQLAGYTLFAIAFGITIYEFLIVGLFLS